MSTDVDNTVNVASVDLDAVNDFNPEKSDIPDLYNAFRKEIQTLNSAEASYKDEIIAEDKPLDEALWLLETSLNTNYGFRKDSLIDFTTDVFEFNISNKSINASGMPVIDGQELVSAYYDLVDAVDYSGSENQYFRFGVVEVSQVTTETSTVVLESESGLWTGVLPPGVDPEPFPPSITNGAAWWAADQFEWRINNHSHLAPAYFGPEYILVLNAYYRTGQDYPDYLWWRPSYSDCSIQLDNAELNQYLLSTKAFIDIYNPLYNPDVWVAHVYIDCFFDSGDIEGYHTVAIMQIEKIFVGPGGE